MISVLALSLFLQINWDAIQSRNQVQLHLNSLKAESDQRLRMYIKMASKTADDIDELIPKMKKRNVSPTMIQQYQQNAIEFRKIAKKAAEDLKR
jgi:hypothetical protein